MSFAQTEQAVYRYGDQLNIPWVPDADYDAGTVFDMGTFVAILLSPAKSGVLTTRCWRGVCSFLKVAATAINVGDTVLWDDSANLAYVTGGGYTDNACIGKCAEAAAANDLTVMVIMIETAHSTAG